MSTVEVAEKVCCDCNESWPADAEFFHRVPGNCDGLSGQCKACRSDYDRKRNRSTNRKPGALTRDLQAMFATLTKQQPQLHQHP
ncbi:hypothetical protein [Comamonas sp. NoAH]|uniref:hypothetical protein n=1 Tax=Comamonas halotolerans TaxID=3041496 RepID=UPI0024E13F81|nr:hypothetical protein [Comamonas sp. NoAH]